MNPQKMVFGPGRAREKGKGMAGRRGSREGDGREVRVQGRGWQGGEGPGKGMAGR